MARRKNIDAITEWQMVAANVVARYFYKKQPVARTCIELSERINSRKGASYHKSLPGSSERTEDVADGVTLNGASLIFQRDLQLS